MGRKMSQPEKRAQRLFDRFGLSEIHRNDGNKNPKIIYLDDDKKGTSLIKNHTLYSDYPASSGKSPKKYVRMVPDCFFRSDFIEIKSDISGKDWNSLSRDSLNDNIRLFLLRMKIGYTPSIIKKYHELEMEDREMVDRALKHHTKSNPMDRYYMYWDDLTSVTMSPNQNLIETVLHYYSMSFPIKLVSGMEGFIKHRLFVMDYEIMDKWEKL